MRTPEHLEFQNPMSQLEELARFNNAPLGN